MSNRNYVDVFEKLILNQFFQIVCKIEIEDSNFLSFGYIFFS